MHSSDTWFDYNPGPCNLVRLFPDHLQANSVKYTSTASLHIFKNSPFTRSFISSVLIYNSVNIHTIERLIMR
jgi:hypothetical protein